MYWSFCSKPIFSRRVMLASSSITRMRFFLSFIVPGTLATFFGRRKPFLKLRSQHQLRHDPALGSVPDVDGSAMHIHALLDHREARPLPPEGALVVKNGSKIFGKLASEIPAPWS